jgi:hypothetical protein
MLTFVVLLVGATIAVAEVPEILTLTDDISNDCEFVQITRPSSSRCRATNSTPKAIPAPVMFTGVPGDRRACTSNFLSSPSSKSPGSLLLLLVTQRK